MKRNTIKRKCLNILKVSVFGLLFLSSNMVEAQVAQNGTLYISNNTYVYLDSGVSNFAFGVSPAVSSSTRTSGTYGRLAFHEGVGFSGAYRNSASDYHFFDGYVSTYSTNDFIFPIGHNSVYAPAKVNATSITGVDAAYYDVAASSMFTSTLGTNVTALLGTGYWNIQRTSGSTANAKITLAWSSNITSLIGSSLNDGGLSIVGHTGVGGTQWVIIPSTVGPGTLAGTGTSTNASGTIATNADVDLSTYKYFTLAAKETCAPVIADNGTTTTWTGSAWDNGTPTELSIAVLGANYAGGSFVANSLSMGVFNVTLTDGQVMEIVKGVTYTSGKVIMSSGASLVQRDDSAAAPMIELTKKTRSLARYNYTYMGSPVEENVFSQLAGAYYSNPADNNRLNNHYKWTAGNETLANTQPYTAWTVLNSGNFVESGEGWISSIASQAPFLNDSFTGQISLKFTGKANNGLVTPPVVVSGSLDVEDSSNYNLLSNPYPSAINANKFLDENVNIDGSLYIWEAKTQPATVGTGYYNQSDFITYTKAGATVPSGFSGVFNGKIASAQGFMVRALSSGNVKFNNCMRLSGSADNNSFFRSSTVNTSAEPVVDRFKLNLTSTTGDFNQVLIAYINGLTTSYNRGYDASRNSTSGSQIFTIMGETNQRLAIDARPAFVNTDVVPLGFTTSSPISSTNFQISIVEKEGVFQNDDVDVFIHDKLNNVYHNFDNGVFNFTASQSELLNRFDVVYQSSTLNNQDFDEVNVMVSLSESSLFLSSKEVIDVAYIFDITGRLINKIKVNDFKYSGNFNHAQGVYIVRVELSNGQSVSNKVINK